MAPPSLSNKELLRNIAPNAILDAEIKTTIPVIGTGENFSHRQALLLLRLCLKERYRRASNIWDNKGRPKVVFKDYYRSLTEEALRTIGLSLGTNHNTVSPEMRLFNAPVSGTNAQDPAQAHNDGPFTEEYDSEEYISEDLEEGEPLEEGENSVAGMRDGGEETGGLGGVRDVDMTLALLVSNSRAKYDAEGKMKVCVGWLHDMDGPVARASDLEAICGCPTVEDEEEEGGDGESEDSSLEGGDVSPEGEAEGEDGSEEGSQDGSQDGSKEGSEDGCEDDSKDGSEDSDPEDSHFTDILLDTHKLTVCTFLSQLDDGIRHALPKVKWNKLKLHRVEYSGWIDDFDQEIEGYSPDIEYMQIFVGYELVSHKAAKDARAIWKADVSWEKPGGSWN